jgi:NAD(P)-dependent dehydrogenase (short-subunit alcohol dehydrogenase family)
MVEELSERTRATRSRPTCFGALWVTQAALPILREQGSGHIIAGLLDRRHLGLPGHRHVPRVKWALEGLSQALAQEVKGFGIHVTLIEPAAFSTDWGGFGAALPTRKPLGDHTRPLHRGVQHAARGQLSPGDPVPPRGRGESWRIVRDAVASQPLDCAFLSSD